MLLVILVLAELAVIPLTFCLILYGLLTANVMLVLWTYFIYKVVSATILKTIKEAIVDLKKEIQTDASKTVQAVADIVEKRKNTNKVVSDVVQKKKNVRLKSLKK